MDTEKIFLQKEQERWLFRIHPIAKLLATIPILILISWSSSVFYAISFGALSIFLLLLNIPIKKFLVYNGLLASLLLSHFIFYPLFVRKEWMENTPIFFSLGKLVWYQAAVLFACKVGLRMMAISLLCLLWTLSTTPQKMIQAFMQARWIPYRFGVVILSMYQIKIGIMQEVKTIKQAHRIREQQSDTCFWQKIASSYYQFWAVVLSLFSSALRRPERLAISMDGRAFGVYKDRTYFKKMTFTGWDIFFMLGFWTCGGLIYCILVKAF